MGAWARRCVPQRRPWEASPAGRRPRKPAPQAAGKVYREGGKKVLVIEEDRRVWPDKSGPDERRSLNQLAAHGTLLTRYYAIRAPVAADRVALLVFPLGSTAIAAGATGALAFF